jgi:hypothetical protein
MLLHRTAPAPARWCAVRRREARGGAARARPNIYEKSEDLLGPLGGGGMHSESCNDARIETLVTIRVVVAVGCPMRLRPPNPAFWAACGSSSERYEFWADACGRLSVVNGIPEPDISERVRPG